MTFAQPFSRYEILDRIGAGAMGTVFKARDRELERTVALKVLRPSLARDERYVTRLQREARIVAAMNHPNIVTGYELGEEGGYHFFVMEYVEGRSLRQLLAEWGSFPEAQVLDVAIQVASALDHAYRRGVIHRDIKPGNILIDARNVVKLTDMGLAKGPADATITRDGGTVGTPQYISPEQAINPSTADIRSDLYSLGATLFHMATGQPPFRGDSIGQLITKVLNERPPSVTDENPAISDGISLVIRKLLAKDPSLRYQEPAELLEDLRRVERAESPNVDARRLAAERVAGRRHRRVWAAGAALVLLVIGVAVGTAVWSPERPRVEDESSAFSRRLTAALESALLSADKLRVLERFEAEARGPQRDVIAGARAVVASALREQLDRFVGRYLAGDRRDAARDWFLAPENWRVPERFFDTVLEQELAKAPIGLPSSGLPSALREHYQARVDQLRIEASVWQQKRDERYRRQLAAYLDNDVPSAWREPLARSEFAEAERALHAKIDAFFGSDGRPTREQLPDELRGWAADREQGATSTAMEVISREELREAQALRDLVSGELQELEARRRKQQLSVAGIDRQLERLRRDLDLQPQSASFHPSHDPWREINAELERFETGLQRARKDEEETRLRLAVREAYSAFVREGFAGLGVDYVEVEDPEVRAEQERHRELLAGARDVCARLCSVLLGDQAERPLTLELPGGGTQHLILVRDEPEARFVRPMDDGSRRDVPASEVAWPALVQLAGDRLWQGVAADQRQRLRRGLALWLYVSRDTRGMLRLLSSDPEGHAFFGSCVAQAIDDARAGLGRVAAVDLLRQLRRAFDQRPRPYDEIRRLRDAYVGVVGTAELPRFLVEAVQPYLSTESERRELEAGLLAEVPAGTRVDVRRGADGSTATLVYGVVGMGAAASGEGWQRAGDELRFAASEVELDAVRTGAGLSLPGPVADAARLDLQLSLRFPALPDRARVYGFELRGAILVLGLLRDGRVAALLAPADLLDRPAELHRRLQKGICAAAAGAGPQVIADAEHRLRLTVTTLRSRIGVAAALDGVEIASDRLLRPAARQAARLRLLPLQPLVLSGLELRAEL